MILGITGGSGSGKSLASKFFANNGFYVVDYDKVSREICEKGMPCLKELCRAFGNDILDSDGNLMRKKLGSIVFKDKEKLGILNDITHKYIMEQSDKLLKTLKNKDVVLDAPLLFEAGLDKKCDKVICVLCEREERISRIMERDGLAREQAQNRINSQKSDEFYIQKSNYCVQNSGEIKKLYDSLNKILKELNSVYNNK